MEKHSFDAVIFDLDGVITKTALVHAAAWKEMFDEFLTVWGKKSGKPFLEFTHVNDYLPYVDGKPRYNGVESFLKSRGIELPYGTPNDSTDLETICGLGNRKNQVFNQILERDGVEVYESTINLIKELKAEGIKLGVASSSKNCRQVLERVNILHLFDTRVDGEVSAEMGLKGKPEPDIFTVASKNLGVEYSRTVIIEDAVSGVQAGKQGNFGLVIGIARENNAYELKCHGADIVVEDIADLDGIKGFEKWFDQGLNNDFWSMGYCGYDQTSERSREGILTVGNGYFATRGALEESSHNEVNYPGTYMAGVTNTLKTKDGSKQIESVVNIPNWIVITFKVAEGEWFDPNVDEVIELERSLNFRSGLLYKKMLVRDKDGRETLIESRRFASMANPHHGAIDYSLTPQNFSDFIRVKSRIDVPFKNDGVERNRIVDQRQIVSKKQGAKDSISYILAETTQSEVEVAVAAKLEVFYQDSPLATNYRIKEEPGWVNTYVKAFVKEGESLRVEKLVSQCNSMSAETKNPLAFVLDDVKALKSFGSMHAASQQEWKALWDKVDLQITGDRLAQKLLRLHIYHTLATTSPINSNNEFGIPARGLQGEEYCNHIFSDEQFILPFYTMNLPLVAKSVLHYHYKKIGKARELAKSMGNSGAAYPLHTQNNESCNESHNHLAQNSSIALAFNTWNFFNITGDKNFLNEFGTELYLDICRFWASKTEYNSKTGKYEIADNIKVVCNENGKNDDNKYLRNNAYTNLMVVWLFTHAFDLIKELSHDKKVEVFARIGLTDTELFEWSEKARKMQINVSTDGIIELFDGYFNLPIDAKKPKQAGVLMAFYRMGIKDTEAVVFNLGNDIPKDFVEKNFYYYFNKSTKSSPQKRLIQASIAAQLGKKELAWNLFFDALKGDYCITPDYNTAEGVHLGVMTNSVVTALAAFAGLNISGEIIRLKPNLPNHWKDISFCCSFKGVEYNIKIDHKKVVVQTQSENARILVNEVEFKVKPSQKLEIDIV